MDKPLEFKNFAINNRKYYIAGVCAMSQSQGNLSNFIETEMNQLNEVGWFILYTLIEKVYKCIFVTKSTYLKPV